RDAERPGRQRPGPARGAAGTRAGGAGARLLGRPAVVSLIRQVAAARYGDEIPGPRLASLRRDEHRSWRSAKTAPPGRPAGRCTGCPRSPTTGWRRCRAAGPVELAAGAAAGRTDQPPGRRAARGGPARRRTGRRARVLLGTGG